MIMVTPKSSFALSCLPIDGVLQTLVMHLGSDDPFGSSPTSTSGTSSSSTSSTPLYRQRRLRSSRGDRSLRAASAAPAAATKAAAAITATRGARSGLVMAPRSPRQALDAPAEVQVSGADDGGLDRGGRKLSSSSREFNAASVLSPESFCVLTY